LSKYIHETGVEHSPSWADDLELVTVFPSTKCRVLAALDQCWRHLAAV